MRYEVDTESPGSGGLLRNRRGAVLPIVALCLIVILGFTALAIDVGMLFNTRSEGQRAADTAALAGASALMDFTAPHDSVNMVARAIEWAGRNRMLLKDITPDEVVSVDLIRDSSKVRVWIQRPKVSTFFSGIWGIHETPVGARSAARVWPSGTAGCLKPFAFPDSAYGPADYGRLVKIYETQNDEFMLIGFGEAQPGLGNVEPDISLPCSDRTARIAVGQYVWTAPDDTRLGQVRKGFDALINSDPNLTYNEADSLFYRNGAVETDWRASPRVATVAAFDPVTIGSGTQKVKIINFVTVYFSHRTDKAATTTIWGRIFPVVGLTDNCMVTNTCALNAFRLRLVD
jgi:hypothetical protein